MPTHPDLPRIAASIRTHDDRAWNTAFVLGSGMSAAAQGWDDVTEIPYDEIDGFVATRVAGHSGKLLIGRVGGRVVAAFCGRFHYYEGHDGAVVTLPAQIAHALGATDLVLTTAVGGLNPDYRVGDLVLISDHLNLQGRSPLRDLADRAGGFGDGASPFVDLKDCYDTTCQGALSAIANAAGVPLRRGVIAAVLGPHYETEAEKRMLRALGADAVCMSTVPEVIVARYLGLRVAVVALVTNEAWRVGDALSHHDVLDAANSRVPLIARLLRALAERT